MDELIEAQGAKLTGAEWDELAALEGTIERGKTVFLSVGAALGRIREGRLYRETHGTWEQYINARWQMGRHYANHLIDAAQVDAGLVTIVTTPRPENEAQFRALATAPQDERDEVWQTAVERSGGNAAPARVVAEVIAERQAPIDNDDAERVAAVFAGVFPKKTPEKEPQAPSRTGDEWGSRPEHVKMARAVMGGIDLDPASCEAFNANVGATTIYDQWADGLTRPWFGRVFCNPPYSETEAWVDKLAAEYDNGNVSEAILLVNAKTETRWFEHLWNTATICFVRGRISFLAGDGSASQTGYSASVFAYFGEDHAVFIREFSGIGRIVQAFESAAVPSEGVAA